MNIAFIILAYKNPLQLRILIEHLTHPKHYFFVHIDESVDILPFKEELKELTDRVFWVRRETSFWGSYQCVKALLNGLQQAYEFKAVQFDYFIHLSGQDFPLKSPEFINKTLAQNAPSNFINLIPFPVSTWENGGADRLRHFKFFWKGRRIILHPGIKNFALKIFHKAVSFLVDLVDRSQSFYGGEFYFMLHRSGLTLLLNNIDKNSLFFQRLKFVALPEEIMIQTILMADKGKNDVIFKDDIYRMIDWESNKKGPKEMEEKEISKFLKSPFLFGRKFTITSTSFKVNFDE